MKGQLSLSVRRRPNQVYRNPHASATSRVGVSAFPGLALKEWREGQDELDWARNSVAYQIFADRFAPHPDQGHQSDTGLQLAPWGSTPTLRDFQGGHLLGVVDKMDYLQDLGVNLLYLTPVNTSSAYHRYHPTDFFAVDPLLGGEAAMQELLAKADRKGMRVVVDGVFNHTGRGHPSFVSLMENGPASPYKDWFTVHKWPLEAYEHERGETRFDCWWGIPELPELNFDNPGVRAHILAAGKHWLDAGCAGWRLDAPTRVPGTFWSHFRRTCKEARPDAYLVGEVFGLQPEWTGNHCFDALMNYTFGSMAMGFFGRAELQQDEAIGGDYAINKLDVEQFARGVDAMHAAYRDVDGAAPPFLHLNLYDSHDTARALWMLKGDTVALEQVVLFQMTMPGIPMIYYGDEVGLSGGRDPANRAAFPWHRPSTWNMELLEFFKRATALRNAHSVLRVGGYQRVPVVSSDGAALSEIFAFIRWKSSDKDDRGGALALVVFNVSEVAARDVHICLARSAVGGSIAAGTLMQDEWNSGGTISTKSQLQVLDGGDVKGLAILARQVMVFISAEVAITVAEDKSVDFA